MESLSSIQLNRVKCEGSPPSVQVEIMFISGQNHYRCIKNLVLHTAAINATSSYYLIETCL